MTIVEKNDFTSDSDTNSNESVDLTEEEYVEDKKHVK
jgi:hypothetical protein